jgi:hypothetical protein
LFELPKGYGEFVIFAMPASMDPQMQDASAQRYGPVDPALVETIYLYDNRETDLPSDILDPISDGDGDSLLPRSWFPMPIYNSKNHS